MQMRRAAFAAVMAMLSLWLESSCGVTSTVMYRLPVDGAEWELVARRVPDGVFSRRLELSLESHQRSILLRDVTGDWYDLACGVVTKAPGQPRVSYLINVWGVPALLGGYDLEKGATLGDADIDLVGLRRAAYQAYRGLPEFAVRPTEDVLDWVRSSRCQRAFHARYGYANK